MVEDGAESEDRSSDRELWERRQNIREGALPVTELGPLRVFVEKNEMEDYAWKVWELDRTARSKLERLRWDLIGRYARDNLLIEERIEVRYDVVYKGVMPPVTDRRSLRTHRTFVEGSKKERERGRIARLKLERVQWNLFDQYAHANLLIEERIEVTPRSSRLTSPPSSPPPPYTSAYYVPALSPPSSCLCLVFVVNMGVRAGGRKFCRRNTDRPSYI